MRRLRKTLRTPRRALESRPGVERSMLASSPKKWQLAISRVGLPSHVDGRRAAREAHVPLPVVVVEEAGADGARVRAETRRARSILRRMEWTPSETRTADAPLLVPNQMVHELRVPLDEDDDFGNESVSVPTGTWMSRCSYDESCCVTLLDADSAARSYERKQGCCGLEWAFCRHRAHFSVVLPIGPTNSTPRGDIYRRARPRSVRGASSHSRLPQPDLSRNGVTGMYLKMRVRV